MGPAPSPLNTASPPVASRPAVFSFERDARDRPRRRESVSSMSVLARPRFRMQNLGSNDGRNRRIEAAALLQEMLGPARDRVKFIDRRRVNSRSL